MSNTPLSLLIIRTQLKGPSDIQNVIDIQNKYKVQTLSEFKGTPLATKVSHPEMQQFTNEDIKKDFMSCLDIAMAYIPRDKYSTGMFELIGSMGVGPEKKGTYASKPGWYKYLVNVGLDWGRKDVLKAVKNTPKTNGWAFLSAYGNVDDYKGNWMKRALIVQGGIYANNADEAVYPITFVDRSGKTLSGQQKYTIDMKLDNLPPAKGFWSITMYSARTQLLIKNPINRYLINSEMVSSMKKNDGKIRIFVQNKSPGAQLETNWLPAPQEAFYLVMRIYYPDQKLIKTWIPPSICNLRT
jgi:hypothetical protein